MAEVVESYLREQLEKRREQLRQAIASPDAHVAHPAFTNLLREVDAALQRIDEGTYGICEVCHDTVERDRLISDPLVRFCLDHLNSAEQRALEGDLELAARIQRGLLPRTELSILDWHIQYHYKPAGLVSGDYCDVIAPSGKSNTPIFLIGDVAGKGVAASLLMSHLHAMFRTLSSLDLGLDKLLDMGNRIFCESTLAGQYATLVCGRLVSTSEVEIASAGHLPALLVRKNGVEEFSSTGLPLGMFSTARYSVTRVRLDAGDSLLLFTDGISEAVNLTGAEYGIEHLSVVAGEQYGRAPRDFLAECLNDVDAFSSGAQQKDDQTIMIVHRADSPTGAGLQNQTRPTHYSASIRDR
ncbi:MAG TPA: SpoIIE family protein phosphatase [Candidatus Acidoferrales bacterium]|nr:SpoIIE family protein phosphatase [Candidatus Acidoferrales bacterium]